MKVDQGSFLWSQSDFLQPKAVSDLTGRRGFQLSQLYYRISRESKDEKGHQVPE